MLSGLTTMEILKMKSFPSFLRQIFTSLINYFFSFHLQRESSSSYLSCLLFFLHHFKYIIPIFFFWPFLFLIWKLTANHRFFPPYFSIFSFLFFELDNFYLSINSLIITFYLLMSVVDVWYFKNYYWFCKNWHLYDSWICASTNVVYFSVSFLPYLSSIFCILFLAALYTIS